METPGTTTCKSELYNSVWYHGCPHYPTLPCPECEPTLYAAYPLCIYYLPRSLDYQTHSWAATTCLVMSPNTRSWHFQEFICNYCSVLFLLIIDLLCFKLNCIIGMYICMYVCMYVLCIGKHAGESSELPMVPGIHKG